MGIGAGVSWSMPKTYLWRMETGQFYNENDCHVHGNVIVVRYAKLDFNRHEHGFDKGVAPLLQQCRANGVDTVLLDLEETAYIESLTLGTIIKFKKEIAGIGIDKIRIVNPGPHLEEIFEVQNLNRVFDKPYATLEDALKDLQKRDN